MPSSTSSMAIPAPPVPVRRPSNGSSQTRRPFPAGVASATPTSVPASVTKGAPDGMWNAWRVHFEQSALRPLPAVIDDAGVPAAWRVPLARSLARFQIGEAGEGRIANEVDRNFAPYIDDDYRACLKLFVREEGRHGRILGTMVRATGGSLLEETWTEEIFVVGRRLLGMRHKLIVLQAAEVVGISVYRLIAAQLGDGTIKRALDQIAGDEVHHLAFHAAFFQHAFASKKERAAFVAGWRVVIAAAIAAVVADHTPLFRAMGVLRRDVAKRLWTVAKEAEMRALPVALR